MHTHPLQDFLENNCPNACNNVDLFAIARDISKHGINQLKPLNGPHSKAANFLLDSDYCLDRLYGGYYNDWICGGQWPRMVEFLSTLINTMRQNAIQMTVVFNGTQESIRHEDWVKQQLAHRDKINQILSHIHVKATPPPKIWWLPPTGLKTALKMAVRFLNFNFLSTIDNHPHEIYTLLANNKETTYHGILADNPEYILCNPERYFSAKNLKLTFKGSFETKEFNLGVLTAALNIDPFRLSILMALLGNFKLSNEELSPFHKILMSSSKSKNLILNLANYVQSLPEPDNLDWIGNQIFGLAGQNLSVKFKESVNYYNKAFNLIKDQNKLDVASGGGGYDWQDQNHEANIPGVTPSAKSATLKEETNQINGQEETNHVKVSPEILDCCAFRTKKGLMMPWIYHLLTKREIRIEVTFEEEAQGDLPPFPLIYQALRSSVYGVLFDVQPRKKKAIHIKEWFWTRINPYRKPEMTQAANSNSNVRLQQLWLGNQDYKEARIKAFLTCLRSGNSLMLDRTHVPEHLLILCCVLRYLLTHPTVAILTRKEMDAFLIQAVDPDLQNAEKTQKMEIPIITSRGVQVAALFMMGVEHATFANEACGAPIKPGDCSPWLFFNGKLFQYKLHKLLCNTNLIGACNGRIDQVARVEYLRKAILEGIQVRFSHTSPYNTRLPLPRSNVALQGAQLEVAGVVVGSWGGPANPGNPRFPQPTAIPPRPLNPPSFKNIGRGRVINTHHPKPPLSHQHHQPQTSQQQNKKKYKPMTPKFEAPCKEMGGLKIGIGRGCTLETSTRYD